MAREHPWAKQTLTLSTGEVAGFAPYEKRGIEMLRLGRDKRTLKFLKTRCVWRPGTALVQRCAERRETLTLRHSLGSQRAAKAKREELSNAMRTMK